MFFLLCFFANLFAQQVTGKHYECIDQFCSYTHRDLAPRDISGTSDPFTRVIFNNHSAETSVSSMCVHVFVSVEPEVQVLPL